MELDFTVGEFFMVVAVPLTIIIIPIFILGDFLLFLKHRPNSNGQKVGNTDSLKHSPPEDLGECSIA